MAFRSTRFSRIVFASLAAVFAGRSEQAQVFVIGQKSAMADVSSEFHPTRVELSSKPINERGRRELIRNLEAEQGFAHRPLPLGDSLILMANGNMNPNGDAYRQMLYTKGESAGAGDRVMISTVVVKPDRIVFDLNGGPYLKHRFLRHIEIGDRPLAPDDGAQVSGCRITLVFEGGVPEISAPEVKALLDPIIDFGVKSSGEAYADTLPPFLKQAVAQHDVLVGMNRKMVLAAMGAPGLKVRDHIDGSPNGHYEEWIFGQVPQTVRFVRFIGDRVVQVRIAALGKPVTVSDRDQMGGYLPAYSDGTHEMAMGDVKPTDGDIGSATPPTILKPGEIAPGSLQRVQVPAAHSSQAQTPASDGQSGSTGSVEKLAAATKLR